MINTELGRAANTPISLNDPAVRQLAGKPSGTISMRDFHGKSYGGLLVAGSGGLGYKGFEDSQHYRYGSLDHLPGAPAKPIAFIDVFYGGRIAFAGDQVAFLTGKRLFIDGVEKSMKPPAIYEGRTNWDGAGKFGFVDGQSYRVRIV